MKKTYNSYLPCFPGFYDTLWYCSDMESEETASEVQNLAERFDFPAELLEEYVSRNYDAITYDYDAYDTECSTAYADAVKERLEELGFPCEIHFTRLDRPREYNFRTDYAEAIWEIDAEKLVKYCMSEEHILDFSNFLMDHYGPRDGFIPFQPATAEYWTNLNNGNEWTLAILVRFVMEQESGKGEDIWRELEEEVYYGNIYLGNYIQDQKLWDFLDSDAAFQIKQEYERLMQQGWNYLEAMKRDHPEDWEKYVPEVEKGKARVIRELAEDLDKDIRKFARETA